MISQTSNYNNHNLPSMITFSDGKYITYVYDATGQFSSPKKELNNIN